MKKSSENRLLSTNGTFFVPDGARRGRACGASHPIANPPSRRIYGVAAVKKSLVRGLTPGRRDPLDETVHGPLSWRKPGPIYLLVPPRDGSRLSPGKRSIFSVVTNRVVSC